MSWKWRRLGKGNVVVETGGELGGRRNTDLRSGPVIS